MTIAFGALGVPFAVWLAASSPAVQSALPDTCPPPVRRAGDTCRPRVVRVTIYNQSRLQGPDIDRMLQVTNRVWGPYGVVFETGNGPGAVAVVLLDGPSLPNDNERVVLGTTLFTEGHATPYMRLSLAAAEAFANESHEGGVPYNARPQEQRDEILDRMLGVALAHEMAHYLLDTAQHSRVGLLQAGLTMHELAYPEATRLTLTAAQQRLLCPAPAVSCSR